MQGGSLCRPASEPARPDRARVGLDLLPVLVKVREPTAADPVPTPRIELIWSS